jgi:protein-tyrosine phosphatase
MYHIVNNIFLSNLLDAHNMKMIQDNNIQIVVRLSEDVNTSVYPTNITFYNFEIEDNCLFKTELIDYSKFIRGIIDNNPDKNILIHCNEGQSRSVSVIIFYLMTKHNLSFDQSRDHIKKIKSDIRPNDAFEQVLRTFG